VNASRIGLIGGLSWESTASYYKYFHELYAGGDNEWSAPEIIIDSVDFGSIVSLQMVGDTPWSLMSSRDVRTMV
jgi:aspartate racemase